MKYILLFSVLFSLSAKAEVTAEMEMPTDAGAVTLTTLPCPIMPNKYNFEYAARATDGAVTHLGCWGRDSASVHVWFYNEPVQPFIASFGAYYFKPKN